MVTLSVCLLLLLSSVRVHAQESGIEEVMKQVADLKIAADTIWVLVTAFLVFFMNLGFGMVESGLCRAKNTVNILAKNFIVFAITSLAFWIIGWGFMFGDGDGFLGLKGLLFVGGADNSPATGEAYKGANPLRFHEGGSY